MRYWIYIMYGTRMAPAEMAAAVFWAPLALMMGAVSRLMRVPYLDTDKAGLGMRLMH
jgi:hypothetical protein